MRPYLFLMLCLVLPVSGAHGSESGFEDEVAHLLAYIEQSDCTFIRNGKAYASAEARAHIDRKYRAIKSRISSAEQFITYGASTSSITGETYRVDCGGASMASGDWLRGELEAYRKGSADASPDPATAPR